MCSNLLTSILLLSKNILLSVLFLSFQWSKHCKLVSTPSVILVYQAIWFSQYLAAVGACSFSKERIVRDLSKTRLLALSHVSRYQLKWLWMFFFCNCWDLVLLKFLCGYTQTKIFSILSNIGRIFTLQLCGSGNILPLFTLITKNNNFIVKWLATDACPVKFGLSLYWKWGRSS